MEPEETATLAAMEGEARAFAKAFTRGAATGAKPDFADPGREDPSRLFALIEADARSMADTVILAVATGADTDIVERHLSDFYTVYGLILMQWWEPGEARVLVRRHVFDVVSARFREGLPALAPGNDVGSSPS